MATSRLEIDLSAVERNLEVVRSIVGPGTVQQQPGRGGGGHGVAVCAVLKQDGYGLGAARLAKRLSGGGSARNGLGTGVDMVAVYTLDEARAVADAVGNLPVLVLMPVAGIDRTDPLYRHISAGRVHLTLHSEDQLRQLAETTTRLGATISVHVQVDTGLARGGAMPAEAQALVGKVMGTARMKLAGLMTHFASPCCDADFTREQARLFQGFVESIKPVLKAAVSSGAAGVVTPSELMLHAANSCAAFRARSYHGTMVRVGQALLGYALEDVPKDESFEFAGAAAGLEPSARWTTTIAHVSEVPAGWPVGYGGAWRAPWRPDGKKTRIALVPVGYADGYPRALGGRGTGGPGVVGLTGRGWERRGGGESEEIGKSTGGAGGAGGVWDMKTVYAPVVGRVSMDQITVDITDVPERYLRGIGGVDASGAGGGGPEVELYGRGRAAPNFISTLAAAAGTITHELLTRIGPRVERVYRSPAVSAGAGGTSAEKIGPGSPAVTSAGPDRLAARPEVRPGMGNAETLAVAAFKAGARAAM